MSDVDPRDPDQVEADAGPVPAPQVAGAPTQPEQPVGAVSSLIQPEDIAGGDLGSASALQDHEPVREVVGQAAQEQQFQAERQGRAGLKLAEVEDAYRKLEEPVQLKQAQQMLGKVQEFQESMQQRARDFKAELHGQMLSYRNAVDDLRDYNPNPWADRGTGFAIGSAIAIGLNQLGIGIAGGGFNVAEKMVSDALGRDLQRQKMLLAKKSGDVEAQGLLLGKMREVFKDENVADEAALLAGRQLVEARFREGMMMLAPEKRTLEMQKTLAGLVAQNAEGLAKLSASNASNAIKLYGMEQQAAARRDALSLRRSQFESKAPVGLFAPLGPGFTSDARKLATSAFDSATGTVLPARQALLEFFDQGLTGQLTPDSILRYKRETKRLTQAVRQLKNQGVRYNPFIAQIDSLLATGSENPGAIMAAMKDTATMGAMRRALDEATTELLQESDRNLQTATGHGLRTWMAEAARLHQQDIGGMTDESEPGPAEPAPDAAGAGGSAQPGAGPDGID